jgi:hypothetical protein
VLDLSSDCRIVGGAMRLRQYAPSGESDVAYHRGCVGLSHAGGRFAGPGLPTERAIQEGPPSEKRRVAEFAGFS